MDSIVERFRSLKCEQEGENYQKGFEAGQEWVRSMSDRRQLEWLETLERLRDSSGHDWDAMFCTREGDAYSAAENFAFSVMGDKSAGREEAERFWETVAGSAPCDKDEWVKGFAEGALDIWADIKRQL